VPQQALKVLAWAAKPDRYRSLTRCPLYAVRRVKQLQHSTEVNAEAVRFVSGREAPSEDGKTRSWHKNVCLIDAKQQYHATCILSNAIFDNYLSYRLDIFLSS